MIILCKIKINQYLEINCSLVFFSTYFNALKKLQNYFIDSVFLLKEFGLHIDGYTKVSFNKVLRSAKNICFKKNKNLQQVPYTIFQRSLIHNNYGIKKTNINSDHEAIK